MTKLLTHRQNFFHFLFQSTVAATVTSDSLNEAGGALSSWECSNLCDPNRVCHQNIPQRHVTSCDIIVHHRSVKLIMTDSCWSLTFKRSKVKTDCWTRSHWLLIRWTLKKTTAADSCCVCDFTDLPPLLWPADAFRRSAEKLNQIFYHCSRAALFQSHRKTVQSVSVCETHLRPAHQQHQQQLHTPVRSVFAVVSVTSDLCVLESVSVLSCLLIGCDCF